MSLIIKSRFYNNSNSATIDYSEKNFTRQKKEIRESGTLYRKGNKLTFKSSGALNTTDNSNENTNYFNNQRLINLISIEKKDGNNFEIDCGNWSKDILELLDQDATFFLYKGSTIENFMKDKHRYHVLSQGDILKIGKIYLKVLHIRLNNKNLKNIKTSSNQEESENNNKSKNVSKEENDDQKKECKNESEIKNNLLIELEADKNKPKTRNKKNKIQQSTTENHRLNAENLINNKKINLSMVMTQKLNLTPLQIDINDINNVDNENIKKPKNANKKRNKSKKNKKSSKKKIKNKIKNIKQINPQSKICRICLSGETNSSKNPLICPCICKGSMKYIHYLCLKNWLNLKIESELGPHNNIEVDRPTITYSVDEIFCELCKSKYPDYIKHNGKLYNVTFYKPKYDQFLVLESVRNDNRRTKFIHIIPLNNYAMHRIGRLNNCDLSLPDPSISRVHCCFYIENNQLVLENNSKFGTKVLIQKQKLNMIEDYPLSIETQNTYLKLYIERKFSLFNCCNSSTKSQIKIYPYQTQNQKGFDLFCSMIFKDDDDYSDNEDSKDIKEDKIINHIENNNKEEGKKENIKSELGKEGLKNNNKKEIHEINRQENKDLFEKKERNLIEIKLDEERNPNEEIKLKDIEGTINLKNKNFQNELTNKNNQEKNLIDEDKTKGNEKVKNIELITDEINKNPKKEDFPIKSIKLNRMKDIDLISERIKSNNKNESILNGIINDEISNKSMKNLISIKNKVLSKINNKGTESQKEYLIQLESEQYIEKEKKSVINNLFKNNDIQTLKGYLDNININEREKESDKNNETPQNKSNKSINLEKINNLSYKGLGERFDNKDNFSFAYNYDSIFGLLPNGKNENFLLFAPKHNKNIKFENYNIHFESEKVTNQKKAKKIWDNFNWEIE